MYYHGKNVSGEKSDKQKVNLTRLNIAWDSDKKYKFSNGACKIEGKCTVEELKESKYKLTKCFKVELNARNSNV